MSQLSELTHTLVEKQLKYSWNSWNKTVRVQFINVYSKTQRSRHRYLKHTVKNLQFNHPQVWTKTFSSRTWTATISLTGKSGRITRMWRLTTPWVSRNKFRLVGSVFVLEIVFTSIVCNICNHYDCERYSVKEIVFISIVFNIYTSYDSERYSESFLYLIFCL